MEGRTQPIGHPLDRWAVPVFWACLSLAFALGLLQILLHCGGDFNYSLDDPYIHLALAKNIAQGSYGLNPGQAAAPSSSILWPFLLAPFAWTGAFFEWIPLALNCVFAGLAAGVLLRLTSKRLPLDLPFRAWAAAMASLAIFLAANGVGVIFTGMEHSLHILCALLAVSGLLEAAEGEESNWALPTALALGPLVRYEALLMTLLGALALMLMGRWKQAALGMGAAACGLGGFSFFLHNLGLGILPSSVQAKSAVAGSEGASLISRFLSGALNNWEKALETPAYLFFIAAALALLIPGGDSKWKWASLAAMGSVAGHFLLGDRGWMLRYEIYLYASLLPLMLLGLLSGQSLLASSKLKLPSLIGLGLTGAVLCIQSYDNFLITPLASGTIHRQQRQMMRFVRDFHKAPAAVNDLGWVAFAGGHKTLDLWGLGSKEALKLRKSNTRSDWVLPLCRREGASLMMIYPSWIYPRSAIPDTIYHLGTLKSEWPYAHGAAEPQVEFYALDDEAESRLRPLLVEFAKGLPKGSNFIESAPR